MNLIRPAFFMLITCIMSACDTESTSDSQHNVIRDNIYNDQFDAINKAKQVENVLLESAQKQRDAIDAQSGQ